ncbi:MAG: CoA-binding protein, partial [Deltaproteobacteria bacterium]|nr:CoA-binding protein [Deltaproteobacteria bacterium]
MELKKFFTPASVAIIGASKDISTINGKPLHYLQKHGYAGKIYPVNPKYEDVGGCRCYPSLEDIPGKVDLALIAVNYRLVPAMLKQCVRKGVRFATIFSSGFAEAGEEGRQMQGQLSKFASKTGLRICGPNC